MNKGEQPGRRQPPPGSRPTRLDLESLAIEALTFFGANPDRAALFFTWSGLDAETIRAAAGRPGFALGVLEYLMQDEATLLSFAAHTGLEPEAIAGSYEARRARELPDDGSC